MSRTSRLVLSSVVIAFGISACKKETAQNKVKDDEAPGSGEVEPIASDTPPTTPETASALGVPAEPTTPALLSPAEVVAIIDRQDGPSASLTQAAPVPMPDDFAARLMNDYKFNTEAVATGDDIKKAETSGMNLQNATIDAFIWGYDTPIRDQGSRATCGVFATISAIENLTKRNKGIAADFSEEFLWWAQGTTGQQMPQTLAAAQKFWLYGESDWPYNAANPVTNNNKFLLLGQTQVSSQLSVAFNAGYAAVGVFDTNSSWKNPTNGVVAKSAPAWVGTDHGVHAVAIVGIHIENGNGYVAFKNSWGPGWGNKGYGFLPLDYCNSNRCEWYILKNATYNWN